MEKALFVPYGTRSAPALEALAKVVSGLDLPIEKPDFHKPGGSTDFNLLLVDELGCLGQGRLLLMLYTLAEDNEIVAYHMYDGHGDHAWDVAFCSWALWNQWIAEDPSIAEQQVVMSPSKLHQGRNQAVQGWAKRLDDTPRYPDSEAHHDDPDDCVSTSEKRIIP